MNNLSIRKKSINTWLHTDSVFGDFIISKFYFNSFFAKFQIVEEGNTRLEQYEIANITLYDDTDGGAPEYFTTITELSLRLEELQYPAFDRSGGVVSISGLIEAGTNVTITGSGSTSDPYVINASGGGGTTPNLSQVLNIGGREVQKLDTGGDVTLDITAKKKYIVNTYFSNDVKIQAGTFAIGDSLVVKNGPGVGLFALPDGDVPGIIVNGISINESSGLSLYNNATAVLTKIGEVADVSENWTLSFLWDFIPIPTWQDVILQNGIVEINSGTDITYLDYSVPGSAEEYLYNAISYLQQLRSGNGINNSVIKADETRNTIFLQTSEEFELTKYKDGGEIILKFQDPITASGTVRLFVPSKAIIGDYVLATQSEIINANTTAQNDSKYTVIANATFTDPTPVEGKGYTVFVRNGTATIGGVGYTAGSLVYRFYYSGAWSSTSIGGTVPDADASTKGIAKLYTDLLASNTDGSVHQSAIVSGLALKQDKPQILNLTSDYTLTSSTSAQKLFNVGTGGNGAFDATASTIYEFELFVDLSTLSSTSGFFSFSLTGTATYNNLRLKTTATKTALITGSAFEGVITSASAYQLTTANTATVGTIVIKGLINVNGAGTIIPTITLSQASAGVVLTNSYCKLTKI